MNATPIEVLAPVARDVLPVAASAMTLRTLEGAEMIHVGGGYCAADY